MYPCSGVWVCALDQQQQRHIHVIVVRRDVKRCQTVLALRVRIRVLVQEHADNIDVAILCCYVNGREALLKTKN